jgi:hypothetical protein
MSRGGRKKNKTTTVTAVAAATAIAVPPPPVPVAPPLPPKPLTYAEILEDIEKQYADSRKQYEYWLLDQPSTWNSHIESFQNQIFSILKKRGFTGLSADNMEEIERLDKDIKYCTDMLKTLDTIVN